MWWLEGVLELFDKYLEKCLWPHIFELCFSLTHGKKNCPNRCLKICSTANIVLHILPSGLVSSYMTLRKEECQQNTFSQVGNETEQFPWIFVWYWGIEESVRTLLEKRSSEGYTSKLGRTGYIKLQNFEGTYFMHGHS